MADQQQSLRLFHASNSFCGVMVRGNIALSTGKPTEAIEHYTEVLYKLSPGNVCALLNRSMASLEEGYYELAAMDAHRAKIAADELRQMNPVANQRWAHVAKYINAERMHVAANDDWTKEAHRNIGEGWAKSHLASILVSATPGVQTPTLRASRNTLARALEIRAIYRLCGALFMVGDGARKDAIDLIEDMKSSMGEESWASDGFKQLEDDILGQLVSEVDPNDPMAISVVGSDTRADRDERMKKQTEMMKTRTTLFRYGDYPWNTDEPEFKGIYWQMRVQEWLRDYDIFSPVVVGTDETQPISSKPHVELRAARDIKSGEPILAEQRISNVTTSISEPLKEDEEFTKARDLELSYCTGCASLIAIPWKLALKTQKEQILPPYVVSTCAQPCRQLRLDLNIGMCATNIEQELCNENLDDSSSKMMTERKTQCLRDLIFLRHVAMAMTRDKSPLDFKQLVFATCGPHTRDASEITELDRWSYTSHVVRPLAYLDKHLASTNTDQFANLDKFDGWIIHALLSKISRGMRVLKGPQYAQVYHKDTKPKISFGPNHPCWKDLTTKLPGNKDDDSLVWIAGINPLLNMIRIADPAKGESANVAVLQEDALFVFAAETGDGSLAVRAGEPLLRTEDERENRKLLGRNGRVYTGEQLGRGFLDVTDDEDEDDEEEEGAHSGDTSEFLRESSEEEVEGGGEGEGGVVLPAEDPRAGDWFSSWSWRNGRLSMG